MVHTKAMMTITAVAIDELNACLMAEEAALP
jgi:hypothetical protein